jgi:hypothetical protein
MTATPCSTIVDGKPCGSGGGGGVSLVTSTDGSVVITNPAGPIVDLAVAATPSVATRDYSVNAAAADLLSPGEACLRTGSRTNAAGAYNGGGVGNKAILGAWGFGGLPMGSLLSASFKWENHLGPGGPNYIPPTGAVVVTPYMNLIVDFGGGDLRILVLASDQLPAAVSAVIGSYLNVANTLTYSWTSALAVAIVNAPPNAVPGAVPPLVSVGPTWLDNAYSFAALVAANPAAVLVDAFPANALLFPTGDGGAPVGAIMPAAWLVSGDSGNVTKSGKRILSWKINGTELVVP